MRGWRRLSAALVAIAVALTTVMILNGTERAGAAPKRLPPPVGQRPPGPAPQPPAPQYPALPPDSGTGRRIVYSLDQQRVWIVEADERTSGSWLVSGRKSIPRPGTYSIYSRSRWTTSKNGSVRMEYMLRFTKASSGTAIGFHAIPVDKNGEPVQSEEELGQPRSAGCVRQARANAEHLWNWAPDGTTVRVTP